VGARIFEKRGISMTEEHRKITAQCDWCSEEKEDEEAYVIVLRDKSVMILCETHLKLLKEFCEKIDVKWSEITI